MAPSLAVKCVCPACFEEIYLGECRIVSGKTTGKVLKDPSKNLFARMRVEPLDGREYTLELAQRECPKCLYLLPSNIELVPSLTLAVVGDTYSGKSHYIAALIHQIKADWFGNATGFARFTCLTPDVEAKYTRDYFDILFKRKQSIQITPPAKSTQGTRQEPLIYKLAFSPSSKHLPTTINLMIYDVSGEDFGRYDRVVDYARFAFNTNAFIFVVDPITIDSFYYQLDALTQLTFQNQFNLTQGFKAAARLSAIIDIVQRYRGLPDGASFPDIPMAVMLSKADLLQCLTPPYNLPSNHTFFNKPQYGQGVDRRDIDSVDQEVRKLLMTYRQGEIFSTTNRFKRKKFFATSATGEPPDASGYFRNVEPTRCLDPLLWILYELEFIRASV